MLDGTDRAIAYLLEEDLFEGRGAGLSSDRSEAASAIISSAASGIASIIHGATDDVRGPRVARPTREQASALALQRMYGRARPAPPSTGVPTTALIVGGGIILLGFGAIILAVRSKKPQALPVALRPKAAPAALPAKRETSHAA